MKILLVYPSFPDTYWSFKIAVKFIARKATHPPLGLMTVATMLPENWEKRLIDLNVKSLTDHDLQWADFVFVSAMGIQRESAVDIIDRCRTFGVRVVAGGPLFTEEPESFQHVDHLVLGEAEITLPSFLHDLSKGEAHHLYQATAYADLSTSPVPDYRLLRTSAYSSLSIQYTRGCPFDCEFCDITALLGRKVRIKTATQIIDELQMMFDVGWRGGVFFVDDNFIGNKRDLKDSVLPAIIQWMKQHNFPFSFTTEASINLADDALLMKMMVEAGFVKVFVGIETPEEASLGECNKLQNTGRDLLKCVRSIQDAGMEVIAGFIVGFDSDTTNVFQRQIDFIQQSGIVSAMVGLLNAPRKTKLYKRLHSENRILSESTGDNTDSSLNFIPRMQRSELIQGYHKILHGIYSSKSYHERVKRFLTIYNPPKSHNNNFKVRNLYAFFRSVLIIGILRKHRRDYWKLLFWSILKKPRVFGMAVTYTIYGYHFRRVYQGLV